MAVAVLGPKIATELSAVALDYNAIRLTWTEPKGVFDWYEIWVMGNGGWMRRMPVKRGNSQAFLAGFNASTSYTFRIRTVRPRGPDKGWWNYGDWSATASVTTNAARSADHTVTSQADWDNLTGVNYGHIIEITNSVTLSDETLPAIGGTADKFLTIRSATPTPSKAMNQRITLAEGQSLATFQITGTGDKGAITVQDDEDLINFENVRFKDGTAATARVNHLVLVGWNISAAKRSHHTSLASRPRYIEFHRCLFEGQPPGAGGAVDSGLSIMGGTAVTLKDSYFYEINGAGLECHAITNEAAEEFIVDNCHIESCIGFLSGGIGLGGSINPEMIGYLPGLGYFTRNHFHWQPDWNDIDPRETHDGFSRLLKNHWELKYGTRFYVGGNYFENHWDTGVSQKAILVVKITPDGSIWVQTGIINIELNVFDKTTEIVDTGSQPQPSNFEVGMQPFYQLRMINNLMKANRYWQTSGGAPQGDGLLFGIDGQALPNPVPFDCEISHNTVIEAASAVKFGIFGTGTINSQNIKGQLIIRNNIVDFGTANPPGLFMQGGSNGDVAMDEFMTASFRSTNGDFATNLMYNDKAAPGKNNSTTYPGQLHEPAGIAGVNFVNLAGGNYRLQNTSQGFQAAKEWGQATGKDVGADIDAVEAATVNSLSGDWT